MKKVPRFDGRVENYEKWVIKRREFAEAEGLSNALGDAIDLNMPNSSVFVIEKMQQGIASCHCEDKLECNGLLGIGF